MLEGSLLGPDEDGLGDEPSEFAAKNLTDYERKLCWAVHKIGIHRVLKSLVTP